MKAKDAVVEVVREKLLQRSDFGLKKYGAPIATNPADHRAKLMHALEEALDLANYLQWCIMELDGSPDLIPNHQRGTGALAVNEEEINANFHLASASMPSGTR